MILLINICKNNLHYFEFVKPVEDILNKSNIKYFSKDYKKITKKDLEKSDKIIICGTSLFDNDFINNYHRFDWLLTFDKPVLGICGGMQIIGMIFKGRIRKKTEIGFYNEKFNKMFLGIVGETRVYHLHNSYVKFDDDFDIFAGNLCAQAVKHKTREIYGTLFHPEVRQKDLIKNFCLI